MWAEARPHAAAPRETRLAGWFAKALGIAILALSAVFVIAVLTWSVTDPSLSNVSALKPKNGLGPIGAILSDLVIQSLGLASVFALLPPVFWSAQLLAHSGVAGIRSKLLMAPIAVLCLAAFLSTLPKAAAWPLASGYGGLLGDFGSQFVTGLFAMLNAERAPLVSGFCLMAAGFALLMLALGLTPQDIKQIARRPHVHLPDSGWVAHLKKAVVVGMPDEDVLAAGLPSASASHEAYVHPSPAPMQWQPPMQPVRTAAPPAAQIAMLLEAFPPPARPVARSPEIAVAPIAAPAPPPPAPAPPAPPAPVPTKPAAPIYRLPPTNLLPRSTSPRAHAAEVHVGEKLRAQKLSGVLDSFGVRAEVKGHLVGPVLTTFTVELASGTKSARLISLADDIARGLNVSAIRVDATPSRPTIGIEIPHDDPVRLGLRDFIEHDSYRAPALHLPLALGATARGEPCVADLADLPHLLLAGTDDGGRVTALNALVAAMLYRQTPQMLRFAMIGAVDADLAHWSHLPHLTAPVTTTAAKANEILAWAAAEVDARTLRMRAMAQTQTIEAFNARLRDLDRRGMPQGSAIAPMPYLVVVIADLARLLADSGIATLDTLDVILRRGRAAGIHIIAGTSRVGDDAMPSGLLAAFNTRIALRLDGKSESRALLGETGAEDLLPVADALLYTSNESLRLSLGGGQVHRLHTPLILASEAKAIAAAVITHDAPRTQVPPTAPALSHALVAAAPTAESWTPAPGRIDDTLYDRAVEIVRREQSAQSTLLRRLLNISYPAALDLLEQMARDGIVSTADAEGHRHVLLGRAA